MQFVVCKIYCSILKINDLLYILHGFWIAAGEVTTEPSLAGRLKRFSVQPAVPPVPSPSPPPPLLPTPTASRQLDIPIPLSCIDKITLSPWMHPDFSGLIKHVLHGIDGCKGLDICASVDRCGDLLSFSSRKGQIYDVHGSSEILQRPISNASMMSEEQHLRGFTQFRQKP